MSESTEHDTEVPVPPGPPDWMSQDVPEERVVYRSRESKVLIHYERADEHIVTKIEHDLLETECAAFRARAIDRLQEKLADSERGAAKYAPGASSLGFYTHRCNVLKSALAAIRALWSAADYPRPAIEEPIDSAEKA